MLPKSKHKEQSVPLGNKAWLGPLEATAIACFQKNHKRTNMKVVLLSWQTKVIMLQVELKATAVYLIGECNQETYPLQKKRHSLPYLRSIPHLRPRTNTFGAVTRVRSALAFATHQFFRESGFQYIHTPILSASDCEGAGEMFQVSFMTCVCYAWMHDTCVLTLTYTGA